MFNVGTIFALLTLRDDLSPKLKAALANVKSAGQKMRSAGLAMTAAITVPLVAVGVTAVRSFADFDASMTQSTAIMGDVSDAMRNRMADAAREMAKTTSFSAKQAADSYFYLASAGLDAEASVAALPQVASFAQAGMFDMARATDLLTDAQSALGLTIRDDAVANMENMGRVSDVLVRANTLANASVEQFSVALTSQAGPAAKSFGVSLEDTVATLAAYADQGIKAELAGNSFARMLRLLIPAATENADEFERLGIKVFDASGNLLPMADIVESMTNALGDLSPKQKSAELTALGFQKRMQSVILPLIGTQDALRGYKEQLDIAAGTTKEVADKQLKTFWEQWGLLKDRVYDAAITLGQAMVPVLEGLRPLVDDVIGVVTALAQWFARLPRPVQATAMAFFAIAAAVGPLLLVGGQLALGLVSIIELIGVVGGGAGLVGVLAGLAGILTGPVGIIALVGTGVVVALSKMTTNADIAASAMKNLRVETTLMKGPAQEFMDAFEGGLDSVRAFMKGLDPTKEQIEDLKMEVAALAMEKGRDAEETQRMIKLLDMYGDGFKDARGKAETLKKGVIDLRALGIEPTADALGDAGDDADDLSEYLKALNDAVEKAGITLAKDLKPQLDALDLVVRSGVAPVGQLEDAWKDLYDKYRDLGLLTPDVVARLGDIGAELDRQREKTDALAQSTETVMDDWEKAARAQQGYGRTIASGNVDLEKIRASVDYYDDSMVSTVDTLQTLNLETAGYLDIVIRSTPEYRAAADVLEVYYQNMDMLFGLFRTAPDPPDLEVDVDTGELLKSVHDALDKLAQAIISGDFDDALAQAGAAMGQALADYASKQMEAALTNMGAGEWGAALGSAVASGFVTAWSLGFISALKNATRPTEARDIGAAMGMAFSDGLNEQLTRLADEQFGHDMWASVRFSLDAVIADMGELSKVDLSNLAREFHNILASYDQGVFSATEATDAMVRGVGALLEQVDRLGADGGAAFVQIGTAIEDYLHRVEMGQFTVEQGNEVLEASFEHMVGLAIKFGGAWTEQIKEIVAQAQKAGTMGSILQMYEKALAQLKEETLKAVDEVLAGTQRIFEASQKQITFIEDGVEKTITQYNVTAKEQKFLASAVVASFQEMRAAGVPLLDIVAKLRDQMTMLDAGADLFPALGRFRELLDALDKAPIARSAERMDAMAQSMKGLDALGQVTSDTLDIFGDSIDRLYSQLRQEGVSQALSLETVGPQLRELVDMADKYGLYIDHGTQALIDQAREAGKLPPKIEPVEDIFSDIRSVIILLAEALGVDVPEAIKKAADAAQEEFGRAKSKAQEAFFGIAKAAEIGADDARKFWRSLSPDLRQVFLDGEKVGRETFKAIALSAGLSMKEIRELWRSGARDLSDIFAQVGEDGDAGNTEAGDAADRESARSARMFRVNITEKVLPILRRFGDVGVAQAERVGDAMVASANDAAAAWDHTADLTVRHSSILEIGARGVAVADMLRQAHTSAPAAAERQWAQAARSIRSTMSGANLPSSHTVSVGYDIPSLGKIDPYVLSPDAGTTPPTSGAGESGGGRDDGPRGRDRMDELVSAIDRLSHRLKRQQSAIQVSARDQSLMGG